jgi:hypothetical protein
MFRSYFLFFYIWNSSEHYKYENHNCPTSYQKNVQVPVCPLCNTPIPGRIDELPDIRVSRHIDSDCKSDRAVKHRKVHNTIPIPLQSATLVSWFIRIWIWYGLLIFNLFLFLPLQLVYSNRCSCKGCKQKELIPVVCDNCGLNFCLRHRHPQDHSCTQLSARPMGKAAMAALARKTQVQPAASGAQKSRSHMNGQGSAPSGNAARTAYSQSTIQGNIVSFLIRNLHAVASLFAACIYFCARTSCGWYIHYVHILPYIFH